MKNTSTRFLSLFLAMIMVVGLFSVPSFAASTYTLTEAEIQQIEKQFNTHGFVLKYDFYQNFTSSGKSAITGVQRILKALGYTVTVDGSFGPQMKSLTGEFQRSQGMTVDYIIGRNTFNALVAKVRELNNTSTVRDLKINAPTSVNITPGTSTTITIKFSGSGIDSFQASISGSGLSGQLADSSWKPYPQECTAKLTIKADSSFKSATITFNLQNKSLGIIKSSSIKVNATTSSSSSSSSYNAAAIIATARKDIGKTGAQLGYTVPWCAYYVSDLLRSNGVSIARAANPRDLVVNILNSNQGVYYSFRSQNTTSLRDAGLKNTSLVTETSRSNITPQAGDLVVLLWQEDIGNYNWSHVGIVQGYSNGQIKTIEGNVTGGVVAERTRAYNSEVVGILRLK